MKQRKQFSRRSAGLFVIAVLALAACGSSKARPGADAATEQCSHDGQADGRTVTICIGQEAGKNGPIYAHVSVDNAGTNTTSKAIEVQEIRIEAVDNSAEELAANRGRPDVQEVASKPASNITESVKRLPSFTYRATATVLPNAVVSSPIVQVTGALNVQTPSGYSSADCHYAAKISAESSAPSFVQACIAKNGPTVSVAGAEANGKPLSEADISVCRLDPALDGVVDCQPSVKAASGVTSETGPTVSVSLSGHQSGKYIALVKGDLVSVVSPVIDFP